MSREGLIELSKRIVEKALKEGFDEAATLIYRNMETMVKIANSQPSVIQRWLEYNVSIYLAKDKRMFIIELKPSDPSVLEKSIRELLDYGKVMEESIFYAPLPEPGEVTPLTNTVDKSIFEHMDNPYPVTEAMVETAHREKIDSIAGTIDLWYVEKALATSKGVELYEDHTGYQMYIRAFSGSDGSGQWSSCGTRLNIHDVERASSIAARYAVESKNRRSIEPGVYDVILSPLVFGNLIETVADMSSAFSIFMGMSIFMKRNIGDKVASDKLTLIDAPRDIDLPNSTSFDDEGVNTFDKPIIENGVFKTVLHNTKSASKFGGSSTGNAGWIYPRPWNIVVKPGDVDLDEMVKSVKKGLLITNNWYTRLQNYVEGLFSTITRDALFYIDNGEIKHPVEKVRIADTLPRLLNNIDMIGRELYNIMWWEVRTPSKLPYILVRNINISKHFL